MIVSISDKQTERIQKIIVHFSLLIISYTKALRQQRHITMISFSSNRHVNKLNEYHKFMYYFFS